MIAEPHSSQKAAILRVFGATLQRCRVTPNGAPTYLSMRARWIRVGREPTLLHSATECVQPGRTPRVRSFPQLWNKNRAHRFDPPNVERQYAATCSDRGEDLRARHASRNERRSDLDQGAWGTSGNSICFSAFAFGARRREYSLQAMNAARRCCAVIPELFESLELSFRTLVLRLVGDWPNQRRDKSSDLKLNNMKGATYVAPYHFEILGFHW